MTGVLRRGARGAVLSGLIFGVGLAQAHAPPLGARILSDDSGREVVVTNRGLIFHEPSTGASRLLCNEALGISTSELPSVAVLEGGALLVGSSNGLKLSLDEGCTWTAVGPAKTGLASALSRFPNDDRSAIVASYDGETPGLYATHDAGQTWELALATEPGDFVHSLLVAPIDRDHIYAALTQYGELSPPTHALLHSRDGGANWERSPLLLTQDEARAVVAATDPADPETLVLYTIANSPGLVDSRVLLSLDGGAAVQPMAELPEIRDAGYDPAGKLWVATRGGLYAAGKPQGPFETVSDANQLGCVAPSNGGMLVCGHYAGEATGNFGIGRLTAEGEGFEPWLDFSSVESLVQCPEGSPTRVACAQPWVDWKSELQTAPTAAPGATPGGPSALGPEPSIPEAANPGVEGVEGAADSNLNDTESPAQSHPAGGCALSASRSPLPRDAIGAALALALALCWRRARR